MFKDKEHFVDEVKALLRARQTAPIVDSSSSGLHSFFEDNQKGVVEWMQAFWSLDVPSENLEWFLRSAVECSQSHPNALPAVDALLSLARERTLNMPIPHLDTERKFLVVAAEQRYEPFTVKTPSFQAYHASILAHLFTSLPKTTGPFSAFEKSLSDQRALELFKEGIESYHELQALLS
jgi:hypothetical protein